MKPTRKNFEWCACDDWKRVGAFRIPEWWERLGGFYLGAAQFAPDSWRDDAYLLSAIAYERAREMQS